MVRMNDEREYMLDPDQIDWGNLRRTADQKVRLLESAWRASAREHPDLHRKMVQDILGPIAEQLARFCACIEIDLEDDGDDDAVVHGSP